MKNQKNKVTSVHDYNLLFGCYRTLRKDLRTYQSKKESLSVQRLWSSAIANLRRPIFIIGAPRSGTTFLGDCLAQLPEVSYHFEPTATKAAARYVYEGLWSFHKARFFYWQIYSWLIRIHFDGHLRFAEKTPQNCFILTFLFWAFPDAQFIHIIRDGRDAALSYSKTPWLQAASVGSGQREPGGYLHGPYPRFWVEKEREEEFAATSDIHRCIWAWKRYTESAMAAAVALPLKQYFEVRYEALVTNPLKEAKHILEYLGIEEPASQHRFREAMAQAKPNSINRWCQELTVGQLAEIEREAGNLLQDLGYR